MPGENRKQGGFKHIGLSFSEDGRARAVLSSDGRKIGERKARRMSATTDQQKAYLEKKGFRTPED